MKLLSASGYGRGLAYRAHGARTRFAAVPRRGSINRARYAARCRVYHSPFTNPSSFRGQLACLNVMLPALFSGRPQRQGRKRVNPFATHTLAGASAVYSTSQHHAGRPACGGSLRLSHLIHQKGHANVQ